MCVKNKITNSTTLDAHGLVIVIFISGNILSILVKSPSTALKIFKKNTELLLLITQIK